MAGLRAHSAALSQCASLSDVGLLQLARNRRLSEWFIRNLNEQPSGWALESGSVDAVLICVSVQYLCEPERVFAEIFRVLKPGGRPAAYTGSHLCLRIFPHRLICHDLVEASTESFRIWWDGRLAAVVALESDFSDTAAQLLLRSDDV